MPDCRDTAVGDPPPNIESMAQIAANLRGRTITNVASSDEDLWIDLDDGSRLTIRIQEAIWQAEGR